MHSRSVWITAEAMRRILALGGPLMVRILAAADVLRAAGLTVVEVAGWRTRGRELTAIRGGVVHHTATSSTARGDYPTLALVRDGRVGIPGPLSQLGLGRSGTWYVIASGRANHAGVVHSRFATTHANDYSIGVEAEHPGKGTWPAAQYSAYVRGCAALGRHYGITWYGHKEVAAPAGRKVDPTFDMTIFRASVTATAASTTSPGGGSLPTVPGGSLPDPLKENTVTLADLMALFDEAANGSTSRGRAFRDDLAGIVTPSVWAHGSAAALLAAVQAPASVNVQALAVALAPLLNAAPAISDGDVDRIADAVADRLSIRLAN